MVLLPGVPREMKQMFFVYVLPYLEEKREGYRKSVSYLLHGISESKLDEIFQRGEHFEGVTISTFAEPGQIRVPIISFAAREEEAEEKLKLAEKSVTDQVSEFIFGKGESSLEKELVLALREKKVSIATAESCTGGLVSQRITSVPGASRVFPLGLCTYSEEEKVRRLGVRAETLSRFGVYSKECALEMAEGVCALSGAELGIGITGVAGPDGGTDENPVGTVYIAVVFGEKKNCIRTVFGHRGADRGWICRLASSKALDMARILIS
jgi:nicotinamide-nucleotide amidase